MKFAPLTANLIAAIEPWFDDPDTVRYLGRRDWVHRELDLMQEVPGVEFKGNAVLVRHVWVVFDDADEPVSLIDIESYSDGTAGMSIVVAPQARNQGVGQRVLVAIEELQELKTVHTIVGGVEPENMAARHCLKKAGFTIAQEPDEEGMLAVEKKIC